MRPALLIADFKHFDKIVVDLDDKNSVEAGEEILWNNLQSFVININYRTNYKIEEDKNLKVESLQQTKSDCNPTGLKLEKEIYKIENTRKRRLFKNILINILTIINIKLGKILWKLRFNVGDLFNEL